MNIRNLEEKYQDFPQEGDIYQYIFGGPGQDWTYVVVVNVLDNDKYEVSNMLDG